MFLKLFASFCSLLIAAMAAKIEDTVSKSNNCLQSSVEQFSCEAVTSDFGLNFVGTCKWTDKPSVSHFGYSLSYWYKRCPRQGPCSFYNELVYLANGTKHFEFNAYQYTTYEVSFIDLNPQQQQRCLLPLKVTFHVPVAYGIIIIATLVACVLTLITVVAAVYQNRRRYAVVLSRTDNHFMLK